MLKSVETVSNEKYLRGESTEYSSYQILLKLGWKSIYEINFHDYKDESNRVIINTQPPNTHLRLLICETNKNKSWKINWMSIWYKHAFFFFKEPKGMSAEKHKKKIKIQFCVSADAAKQWNGDESHKARNSFFAFSHFQNRWKIMSLSTEDN